MIETGVLLTDNAIDGTVVVGSIFQRSSAAMTNVLIPQHSHPYPSIVQAKFQRAIANVFLTQVQLEREASEKIRKYAAFQLQDSAKCTRVEMGGK